MRSKRTYRLSATIFGRKLPHIVGPICVKLECEILWTHKISNAKSFELILVKNGVVYEVDTVVGRSNSFGDINFHVNWTKHMPSTGITTNHHN